MVLKRFLRTVFYLLLMASVGTAFGFSPGAQKDLPKTPAEAANFTSYSQYGEISRFISLLDHLSPQLEVRIAGRTLPTAEVPAQDLFLCIVTEEGVKSPDGLNRKKPTLFIIASKHGNEQSARFDAYIMHPAEHMNPSFS